MRIAIDDYAYVFVRLMTIKSLLMSEAELYKLRSMDNMESLGNYVTHFFPEFNPEEISVEEFEWMLWDSYFRIIERILVASPEATQYFLKTFLISYEITNIKICIYGVIENTSFQERYWQVYDRPSKILDRMPLLDRLLKCKKIEDLIKSVEDTPYSTIIKKGLNIFKEQKELFQLEHELDKFFYEKMIESLKYYDDRIKFLAEEYIRQEIDYYNLNLIYRALYNGLDYNRIKTYLIDYGNFFNAKIFHKFDSIKSLSNFMSEIKKILQDKEKKQYQFILEYIQHPDPISWDKLREKFLDTFLERFQRQIIQDIPLSSLSLIFQILLFKQREIKAIIQRSVQIAMALENY